MDSLCREHGIELNGIYNADQFGLLYTFREKAHLEGGLKTMTRTKQLSIKIGFVKGDRISLMLRKKMFNT